MEAFASPIWLMAKGKNNVMDSLTVLNMEATRKAFSAVRMSPVNPNTMKVHNWMNLEAEKKKLKLKAR